MAAKQKVAVGNPKKRKVVRKSKKESKTLKKTRELRGKKSSKRQLKDVVGFTPDYNEILDSVEKKFKLSPNLANRFKYAVSSGSLVRDLVLGGGYIGGGMYTNAGGEQSAKSSDIMNFLADQIRSPIDLPGVIQYFDPEGSFDPNYFGNMIGIKSKKAAKAQIFGLKDAQGNWTIRPKVRYYPDSRGEQIMDAINAMLRKLPDMELLDEQWYYVYENTKDNRKLVGSHYNVKLFSKFNKFYVPSPRSTPQGIVVMDSWVSLVPERMDDEDKGSGLGALARFFSENLPKIKSKLRRKNVILLGVNQLREKPMVQGDPRYEPGGQALKFQSDVRIWQTGRSVPHGSGPVEEEPSITRKGGTDAYRYIHIQAKKNKLATPFMQGWMRIWAKDAYGQGRGIDRVWDVFQYLKMTGQITGTRSLKKPGLKIQFKDEKQMPKMNWMDFKALIVLEGDERRKHAKKLGIKNAPDLYALCQKQMRKGLGTKLYYDNLTNLEEEDGDDD